MKKKILFVIPSLSGGGAERVLVLLLRHLNRTHYEPVVVVFDSRNDYQDDIPADVRSILLDKRGRFDFFRLVRSFSRLIDKETPSLICAFLTYTNYLSVLAGWLSEHKVPLLLTEHNNLTMALNHTRLTSFKRILIRNLYPRAHAIITVSNGVRNDLVLNFKVPSRKCKVINNSVEFDRIQLLAKEEVNHPWFKSDVPVLAACGRLITQKNYPMLLRAIEFVLKETPIQLVILGDGQERLKLESYVRKLGIHTNVLFLGFQSNPFKFIAKSTAFVLSSSWEGLGNVLIEAMACGIPVISTRCPYGPDEIITDGVNGLLVPTGDVEAMAKAIMRLLKDEPLRNSLADAGKKRAEDFRVEKMVMEYERLFDRVVSGE